MRSWQPQLQLPVLPRLVFWDAFYFQKSDLLLVSPTLEACVIPLPAAFPRTGRRGSNDMTIQEINAAMFSNPCSSEREQVSIACCFCHSQKSKEGEGGKLQGGRLQSCSREWEHGQKCLGNDTGLLGTWQWLCCSDSRKTVLTLCHGKVKFI